MLAVAALLAVARLLAAQREGETALLLARGATRRQLTRLTAAEVVPLSVVTALAGGVAGIWLARWLGGSLYGQGIAGGALAKRRHQPDGRGHLDGRARGHGPYRRARGRRAALPGAAARVRRQPGSGAAARPRSPASPGRAPTWP